MLEPMGNEGQVMAQAFSVEEVIQRPAPQVWEALTDWPNAHRWMPAVRSRDCGGAWSRPCFASLCDSPTANSSDS